MNWIRFVPRRRAVSALWNVLTLFFTCTFATLPGAITPAHAVVAPIFNHDNLAVVGPKRGGLWRYHSGRDRGLPICRHIRSNATRYQPSSRRKLFRADRPESVHVTSSSDASSAFPKSTPLSVDSDPPRFPVHGTKNSLGCGEDFPDFLSEIIYCEWFGDHFHSRGQEIGARCRSGGVSGNE